MKKGFTLIELLAVIVILAIIAVIAVPIVVTIINDSSKGTTVRSGEFYIDAVENAIMNKNMETGGSFNPTECLINEDGNVTCGSTELKISVEGEKPNDGFLIYNDGELIDAKVTFSDDSIVMNKEEKLVSLKNDVVCARVDEETKTTGNIPSGQFLLGDEYICEVKEGVKYHFFVLSEENGRINLLLDRNITSEGNLVTSSNLSLIKWYDSTSATNRFGPVTAMDFLHNATKDWDKIENIDLEYEDENAVKVNGTYQKGTNGYGSIKTEGETTQIIKNDGTVVASYTNLKARLPKFFEIYGEGKCLIYGNFGSCPLWMVNYLKNYSSYEGAEGRVDITISGYVTLTSYGGDNTTLNTTSSLYVYFQGSTGNLIANTKTTAGVRPVISVSKADIH